MNLIDNLEIPFIEENFLLIYISVTIIVSLVFLIIGYSSDSSIEKVNKVKSEDEKPVITKYVSNFDSSTVQKQSTPPKILIAEDNEVNAKILIKLLERFGIEFYTHVLNGSLACEERKFEETYDLVLMDINMPEMTGDEATQEILKWEQGHDKPHIPIIAVTANALEGDRERFIEQGMDDYVSKPLDKNELKKIILKYTGFQCA